MAEGKINLIKSIGFLISYFIFTTVAYFVLTYTYRIPSNWGYLHIMMITFGVVIFGYILKRWLS
jgi:hypothetical protein